jgi:hypothetical protein
MLNELSSAPVLLAGLYLVGLAAVAFVSPQMARRFLFGFASSALAHYSEMSVRLVIGAALLWHAPQMAYPGFFGLFAWVLIVSSLVLLALPWRWHRRFASWAVPLATRHMALFALVSFAGGAFVILSVLNGPGL